MGQCLPLLEFLASLEFGARVLNGVHCVSGGFAVQFTILLKNVRP